jgi:AcrR family transcriptional regulator
MTSASSSSSRARGGAPAQTRALRAQGKRTMRKLLVAGTKIFDERGYQAARVDDIVKAARTSHGTFYLYFANKEDLFRSLAEDCAAEMTKLADRLGPIAPGEAGFRQVRDWVSEFVGIYRRYGAVIRAWAEEQITNRELTRLGAESMETIVAQLALRIDETDGRGGNGIEPRTAALALVAMLERFNYYLLSRRLVVDDEVVLDTVARLAHAGVFGQRGSERAVSRGR